MYSNMIWSCVCWLHTQRASLSHPASVCFSTTIAAAVVKPPAFTDPQKDTLWASSMTCCSRCCPSVLYVSLVFAMSGHVGLCDRQRQAAALQTTAGCPQSSGKGKRCPSCAATRPAGPGRALGTLKGWKGQLCTWCKEMRRMAGNTLLPLVQ